jgi:uncharacterized coiled-coil protein SlyX
MEDVALEHRLTTIEVTLSQGLADIKAQGRLMVVATDRIDANIVRLSDHVATQNHRIDKVEADLGKVNNTLAVITPKVETMEARGKDTNAVVRFIKSAGGIGNGLILLAVSLFGSVLVGFQIAHFISK